MPFQSCRHGFWTLLFAFLAIPGARLSGQNLQVELDQTNSRIAGLKEQLKVMASPDAVVGRNSKDEFEVIPRKTFENSIGLAIMNKELTSAQAVELARRYETMRQLGIDFVQRELKELEEAAQRLVEEIRNPNASFWRSHTGTHDGTFKYETCSAGSPPAPGAVQFTFSSGGQLEVKGPPAPAKGIVTNDGSFTARSDGASSAWWGRFRKSSDGIVYGQGTFGTQTGGRRCDGTWSVP